jgi:hypothetical protein
MSLVEWLTVISLGIGILTVLLKVFFVIPIKNFIKEQTYPIQPTSNGGRALPDIAHTVNRIELRLDEHMQHHAKDN